MITDANYLVALGYLRDDTERGLFRRLRDHQLQVLGTAVSRCADGVTSCNATVCITFEGKPSDCHGDNITLVASCPSDAVLVCKQSEGTVYYYEQSYVDVLAEESPGDPCAAGIRVSM